jgi:ribosomal protein L7/L12
MFESFSLSLWALLAGIAAIGFYAGRLSAAATPQALARYRDLARTVAAQDFARLSPAAQAEVDHLVAAGKTIAAVKFVRAALNLGLYEAKLIIDQRKR